MEQVDLWFLPSGLTGQQAAALVTPPSGPASCHSENTFTSTIFLASFHLNWVNIHLIWAQSNWPDVWICSRPFQQTVSWSWISPVAGQCTPFTPTRRASWTSARETSSSSPSRSMSTGTRAAWGASLGSSQFAMWMCWCLCHYHDNAGVIQTLLPWVHQLFLKQVCVPGKYGHQLWSQDAIARLFFPFKSSWSTKPLTFYLHWWKNVNVWQPVTEQNVSEAEIRGEISKLQQDWSEWLVDALSSFCM